MNATKLKISLVVALIYATLISLYVFNDYWNTSQAAAVIDGKNEITNNQIFDRMKENHWHSTVSLMIDEALIEKEAQKHNLLNPSEDELVREATLFEQGHGRFVDINNERDREYLTNNLIIKQLAVKHTINDETLLDYLAQHEVSGESLYHIRIYEGEHELVDEITLDLQEGIPSKEIKDKYNIQFDTTIVNSGNEYGIYLDDLQVGDAFHVHFDNLHAALQLIEVERETYDNLDENREEIVEQYLLTKFHYEKINLINFLRGKYIIEMMD